MPWLPAWSTLSLRSAARAARRQPLTTGLALAVIALGVAGATVTYSAVEAVILRTLPYPDAERLVLVSQVTRARRHVLQGGSNSRVSLEQVTLRRGELFDGVAGLMPEQPVLAAVGEGQGSARAETAVAERVRAVRATSTLFALLGAQPRIGRVFDAEDDRPGAEARVLIAHGFWMSRFAGAAEVVGRTLLLDGQPSTIVGVMPERFDYPRDTQIWRAIGSTLAPAAGAARGAAGTAAAGAAANPSGGAARSSPNPQGGYRIVARLRDDVTFETAQAALDVQWETLGRTWRDYDGWIAKLTPLHVSMIGTARRPLWLLFGAALLLLAVACANVANLLLVRAVARQRDVAVRLALGATRGRIVSQFLAESLLLAGAGGAAGVLLAWWAIGLIAAWSVRDVPALADVTLNPHVLALAVAATTLTGLLFGCVPGLCAARQPVLTVGSGGVTRWRTRLGELSLVAQVALTMTLMTAAALVSVSLARLLGAEAGYRSAGIVSAQLVLPRESHGDDAARVAYAERVLERLRARGELAGAAIATGMPFATGTIGTIRVDGEPERPRAPMTLFTAVSDDYFGVMRIPLRRGRLLRFARAGSGEAPDTDAVLINEALARVWFPGRDPIGHRLSLYDTDVHTIVGVVADTRDMSLSAAPDPQVFLPLASAPEPYLRVVARAGADVRAAIAALREGLRDADPRVPVDRLVTLDDLRLESVARWRLVTWLLGAFAAVALAMSAAGIYALAAHHVERRQQEFGIRLALGSGPRRLLRLVFGRGLQLTVTGVAAGLAGALLTGRLLTTFLFELTPRDPTVIGGVALLMAALTMAACALPARRASRIDPARLLRRE